MADAEAKSECIELRTTPSVKALLQHAAIASHKSLAGFLLDAGVKAAEEALLARSVFQLDDARWQAFQDVLNRPVVARPSLARLLAEKSILE